MKIVKRASLRLGLVLLLFAGCGKGSPSTSDDLAGQDASVVVDGSPDSDIQSDGGTFDGSPRDGDADDAATALAPADRNALPVTRRVLTYLKSLPSNKKVLSGQKALGSGFTSINTNTGYIPAIMGGGLECFDAKTGCPNNVPVLTISTQTLIDHWNQGGLVVMTESWGNPKTLGGASDTDFNATDFADLLKPGTTSNKNFMSQLDVGFQTYKILQNEGVVVILHLLIEMNGSSFWWGASEGTPTLYKDLFRLEFNYYTMMGLHNILYEYSASEYAAENKSGDVGLYYPGDEYVDIVGLDYYLDTTGSPIGTATGYGELTTLVAPQKVFALTEFGPITASTANADWTPHDYYGLIQGITNSMPLTSFWFSWDSLFSMGDADGTQTHLNVGKLLGDSRVVNLGNVHF